MHARSLARAHAALHARAALPVRAAAPPAACELATESEGTLLTRMRVRIAAALHQSRHHALRRKPS
jgi:hypothetical protein